MVPKSIQTSGWVFLSLAISFLGGMALAERVSFMISSEWRDSPNLPYTSLMIMTPVVLGFVAAFGVWVSFAWWMSGLSSQLAFRNLGWVLSGFGGAVFIGGFALFCTLLPPWPGLARANRAANYCVNKNNIEWCEYLAKNFPQAVARLPQAYRMALEEASQRDPLSHRLAWARLDSAQRAMIEDYRRRAIDLQKSGQHELALSEIRKVFVLAPDDGTSKKIESESVEAIQAVRGLAAARPAAQPGSEYRRKGIGILENQFRELVEKRQWVEAREVWANIQILDPMNPNLLSWADLIERNSAVKPRAPSRTPAQRDHLGATQLPKP
jgi:tetratricopeptide (TPR) repeat protein